MLKKSCFSTEAGIIFSSGYKPFFLRWILSFFLTAISLLHPGIWLADFLWLKTCKLKQTVIAHYVCISKTAMPPWPQWRVWIYFLICMWNINSLSHHIFSPYVIILRHQVPPCMIHKHFTNMTYKNYTISFTRFNYSHFRKKKKYYACPIAEISHI